MRRQNPNWLWLLILIGFLVGLWLIFYPQINTAVYEYQAEKVLDAMNEQISQAEEHLSENSVDLELTAASDGRLRVLAPAGGGTHYFLRMEGSVMKLLLVFAVGLMVGGLFGVGIICLMISAGRADDAWENRPHNSTTTEP